MILNLLLTIKWICLDVIDTILKWSNLKDLIDSKTDLT